MSPLPMRPRKFVFRISAILATAAIVTLSGCVTPPAPGPIVPTARPSEVAKGTTPSAHPLKADQPNFVRLPNIAPGHTPVRVGVLLPFTNGSPATRALASAMLKAAQLALYDAKNPDIILITADEGGSPETAASGARSLLAQGAEVIVGPLFSASTAAVAPIAHDRAVPVISFSTDRKVAGNGVYLLSYQPSNEVARVVSYAAAQGHKDFAALVPKNAYGERVGQDFEEDVAAAGAKLDGVKHFSPTSESIDMLAKDALAAKPDAMMIAAGGETLKAAAAGLAADGIENKAIRMLGTGLWYDSSLNEVGELRGAWFAAPQPGSDAAFIEKYKDTFDATPPALSTLAYDAMSLVALLAPGKPYHRFTDAALTDPNGFSGISGIFRFNPDGTSERGLAILAVSADGFATVDPAPTTFQKQGS
ncbi:MAG TPA: penicillin-binding protein activator [Rhizomicrobium sp.]|jgi:ABC-type branched-subunit amino acid transport system substrate-binding protein